MTRSKEQKEIAFYAIITEDEVSSFEYMKKLLYFLNCDFKEQENKSVKKNKHHTLTLALNAMTISFDVIYNQSCPSKVQEKAQELRKNIGTTYKKIFCIFDKDSHNNKGKHGQLNHYNDLVSFCKTHPEKLFSANSVPCFEYWLYLHFKNHSAPILPKRKLSASDVMVKMLETELPDYQKGALDFDYLKHNIGVAVDNAEKSIKRYEEDNIDNPMTYMGILHEELKNIICLGSI